MMALADLLKVEREVSSPVREEITPERIADDVPKLKKLIAYWRVYPDKFVDYLLITDSSSISTNECIYVRP